MGPFHAERKLQIHNHTLLRQLFLRLATFQMTDGSSDELLYSRYSVREGQPEVVYSSSNSVRLTVEIETNALMYLVLSYSQADGRLSNTLSPHLSHLRPLH